MKKQLGLIVAIFTILSFQTALYGQAPTLGTTAQFALFTASGNFTNIGTSTVTGDVGTSDGTYSAFPPGTLVGTSHVADPTSLVAASDLAIAYSDLNATTGTNVGSTFGAGQVLTAGIYTQGAASSLDGTLTLDGEGNPDAVFIIKIGGSFTTNTSSNIVLTGSATQCNVYWQVNGAFNLGVGSVFYGTVIANGAITLNDASLLYGRALSIAGYINANSTTVTIPSGCLTSASAPAITSNPSNQSLCAAGSVSFSVIATGTGLTYQWRKGVTNLTNGENIYGATSASLTINPAALSDVAANYNVVVSGTDGPDVISTNASLVMNTIPSISTAPVDLTICAESSANFEVIATGTNLTYQWRKGTTNIVNAGNISGAKSAKLTISPVDVSNEAANYNVIVSGTCSPSVTSNNVSLIVNPLQVITSISNNKSVCSGSSVSFTVAATGKEISYQWRKGTEILTNAGSISGVSTATLTIDPVITTDAATNYNVVVSGTCAPVVTSNDIALVVNIAPNIITSPVNQNSCVGSSINLSVVATGTNLTYQWRKGTTAIVNAGNISGAKSAKLTINPVSISDAETNYNVVVSGTCEQSVTSANAALVVNVAANITTAPVNQSACAGKTVSFAVVATGTGLTYQWRKGNVNLINDEFISGATLPTLTINPVNIGDAASNYNVVVTSGACTPSIISENVSLFVIPNIITNPNNQMTSVGSSVSYSVIANGTNLTYQWRKGNVNISNNDRISGANTAKLTINSVVISDAATDYNVVVTGTCAPSSISNNAALWICNCPTTDVKSATIDDVVSIYPDPFTTYLNIKINSDVAQIRDCELTIYSFSGEMMISMSLTEQLSTIDTSDIPAGVYMYTITGNGEIIQSGKLISQQ